MARIRSIKPELRTSITVSVWPREVRYFFVLLWGYLDDYGRGVDDEMLIASDCFPRDRDITPDTVDAWLELMADSGPLCRYEVDGRRYLHAPNWREHQKPQHPTRSKVPPCPDDEPDDFDMWRKANPERLTKRSRKAREELRKIPAAFSRAPQSPSGAASAASSDTSGATVIQMPGQIAIDDAPEEETADHDTYGNAHESLMNPSGNAPEQLTPEQGSKGAREQGAREGERAGAGERTNAHETPPAPRQPDGPPSPIDDARFELNDAMRRWALATFGPGLDVDYETAQFIDHHRAEGRNRRNWHSEWQKWLRRSAKWASERRLAPTGTTGYSPFSTDQYDPSDYQNGF